MLQRNRFAQTIAVALALLIIAPTSQAQTLTTLASFGARTGGTSPRSRLVADDAGNLYGTTRNGGANNVGTIYRVDPATGLLTTLHSFIDAGGAFPEAGLILDSSGRLFGTTSAGGDFALGTVFRFDLATGVLTTLVSFDGQNGSTPYSSLVTDSTGALLGTTFTGGPSDLGTVFRVNPASGELTTLVSFDGVNGSYPVAGLLAHSSGMLYGTTSYSGTASVGTVFSLDPSTGALATIASFNGTNGSFPEAALAEGPGGTLYGCTPFGGDDNSGTVFRVNLATAQIERFASFNFTNGNIPLAGLYIDANGFLFGTTSSGGSGGAGTIFKVDPSSGSLTTVASFNETNGASSEADLIADADGTIFGTTAAGGCGNVGTVFSIDLASGALSTVACFQGPAGENPRSALVADAAGDFYGTTSSGGSSNLGTIFKIDPATGELTTLASFRGANGATPLAGLVIDSNGMFYGTTSAGGASNDGALFKFDPTNSTLTTLHSFSGSDGTFPASALSVDRFGMLFGTTRFGGLYGVGVLFQFSTASGTFTTLVDFDYYGYGGYPLGGVLVWPIDNNLIYGTTSAGGYDFATSTFGICGTIFSYNRRTGVQAIEATFTGANGCGSTADLVADRSGILYGTTRDQGPNGYGTAFKFVPFTRALTTELAFDVFTGTNPESRLLIDRRGILYGTTRSGGTNDRGTVFRLNPATGAFTKFADLSDQDGSNPVTGLVADSAGTLYGTALSGGANGAGTVFAIADSGFLSPASCPGDANIDLLVNFDDLTTVLATFGRLTAPFDLGDANGSGRVDFDDLTTVLANFGSVCR